jgi:hypothetical protein
VSTAATNKPDDTGVKDILSPFAVDRSALADCFKLVAVGADARQAVLIYGFDAPQRPVAELIDAFEFLARQRVLLGERLQKKLENLVHPVHCNGGVFMGGKAGCLAGLPPSSSPRDDRSAGLPFREVVYVVGSTVFPPGHGSIRGSCAPWIRAAT